MMIEYSPTVIAGFTFHMQTIYMSWLTMALVILIMWLATRNLQYIPSGAQNVVEAIIEKFDGLIESGLGDEGRRHMAPFIITLFMYIFIGNELGLLPQVIPHFHFTSPTNDINTTIGLGIMVLLWVQIVGISRKGPGFLKHFISPHPLFFPMVVIDEAAKIVTMGFRLFGNILAGEILLLTLYALMPWVVPDAWIGFSLVIGLIQAFIFTMLSLYSFVGAFSDHH